VIARPTAPFSQPAIQALRDYMKPADTTKTKGKLFILFGVAMGPDGKMVHTGLEDFVREFNVQVGNERVLKVQGIRQIAEHPAQVLVQFNPALGEQNPLLATFGERAFIMYNTRPVKPLNEPESPRPRPGNYTAESLLIVHPSLPVWSEPDLQADPTQLANKILRSREEQEKKLSVGTSIAVTVSEPKASADPHAFMEPTQPTPRLVVFGNSTVASNWSMPERGGQISYEVVANTLDWLRDRPGSIGIEPKNRNLFVLEGGANVGRMIMLPSALMFLGIIGLGAGVWVVRRK
jgi:hypothetical protein